MGSLHAPRSRGHNIVGQCPHGHGSCKPRVGARVTLARSTTVAATRHIRECRHRGHIGTNCAKPHPSTTNTSLSTTTVSRNGDSMQIEHSTKTLIPASVEYERRRTKSSDRSR
jgi:hypothetical protein